MKRGIITIVLVVGVCLFVLWPVVVSMCSGSSSNSSKLKESGKTGKKMLRVRHGRPFVGCIPIKDGKIFLINGRTNKKLIFPKGGIERGEEGYYSAGKEALEEAGLIGNIDKAPFAMIHGIYWYVLEVTKVLPEWNEKHERLRIEMDPENVLYHSEVRAVTKNVVKELILQENRTKNPRIKNSSFVSNAGEEKSKPSKHKASE
ncbi:diphosphoinositol-polyphosphate diphosphatase [Nematocida ausubeli]|nr:diphosphoinositol-polyphosphate diphosphatase [Nematocida ausubeli]